MIKQVYTKFKGTPNRIRILVLFHQEAPYGETFNQIVIQKISNDYKEQAIKDQKYS